MDKKVVIVIPIYNKVPDSTELISLNRGLRIFESRSIFFVYPSKMDVGFYRELSCTSRSVHFISFPDHFFENPQTYNRLMLSAHFYKRFSEFEFLLIYQTDAFVFRDELDYWCSLGYDYFGAPLIKSNTDGELDFHEFGGNGGFSLRNIKACINVLSRYRILDSYKEIMAHSRKFHGFFGIFIRFPLLILRSLGFRNNSKYFISRFEANEDVFWSKKTPQISPEFKRAPAELEIEFAFDRYPEELFKLNKGRIPFGCHAWNKNYDNFWKIHIPHGMDGAGFTS